MDEIRIENLEVYACHGVYSQENRNGQLFFVNVTLYTDIKGAAYKDELSFSTNYGEVCHFITEWMQRHTYKLIETVAENLAAEILLRYNLVKEVALEVRKPKAPIGLPFGCVSVYIHRGWHQVYLSVGSNMGDKRGYIEAAVSALKKNSQIKELTVSELLVTKPYGGVEQDDFLNGALAFQTLLSPGALLEELRGIEAAADRRREVHWGPRTLDLDIIFYDKLVYEDEQLIIPHVDMQNRYFVLKPLSGLAPNYRHPVLGKTVSQLLQALDNAE